MSFKNKDAAVFCICNSSKVRIQKFDFFSYLSFLISCRIGLIIVRNAVVIVGLISFWQVQKSRTSSKEINFKVGFMIELVSGSVSGITCNLIASFRQRYVYHNSLENICWNFICAFLSKGTIWYIDRYLKALTEQVFMYICMFKDKSRFLLMFQL